MVLFLEDLYIGKNVFLRKIQNIIKKLKNVYLDELI